ncbi:hypothetical protein BDV12DRAFT_166622 [Aspergillus spectabilis]
MVALQMVCANPSRTRCFRNLVEHSLRTKKWPRSWCWFAVSLTPAIVEPKTGPQMGRIMYPPRWYVVCLCT